MMGFSISWGSRGAGFLRTTKEVSGRKAKANRYEKNGPRSGYPDEKIVEVLTSWLRGERPSELISRFGVSKSSLHGWLYLGNRDDLMKKAEEIVPASERKTSPRGYAPRGG